MQSADRGFHPLEELVARKKLILRPVHYTLRLHRRPDCDEEVKWCYTRCRLIGPTQTACNNWEVSEFFSVRCVGAIVTESRESSL